MTCFAGARAGSYGGSICSEAGSSATFADSTFLDAQAGTVGGLARIFTAARAEFVRGSVAATTSPASVFQVDDPDSSLSIVDTVIVMPAVLPPTASSAPLLYSLYLVLPAYLRCARGVILQHEGHCKFCSWAWLETLDRLPPEEEEPKGHFVRHRHGQDNASSRALASALRHAAAILRLPSPIGKPSQDRSSRVEKARTA